MNLFPLTSFLLYTYPNINRIFRNHNQRSLMFIHGCLTDSPPVFSITQKTLPRCSSQKSSHLWLIPPILQYTNKSYSVYLQDLSAIEVLLIDFFPSLLLPTSKTSPLSFAHTITIVSCLFFVCSSLSPQWASFHLCQICSKPSGAWPIARSAGTP